MLRSKQGDPSGTLDLSLYRVVLAVSGLHCGTRIEHVQQRRNLIQRDIV